MKNQKKNKVFIVLVIAIIVILSVLCVLFATDTIEFKSNGVNNSETTQSDVVDNTQPNQEETVVDNNQSNQEDAAVDSNQSNQDDTSDDNSYNFGDDVVLTQLSSIPYEKLGDPDYIADFSEWKVLKDEGEYITLYYCGDDELYGKTDKNSTLTAFNERKILFTTNGIDFGKDGGEIRLLNESDLLLFGCDFDTLTFSNLPDWVDGGWTSYTKDNYSYYLSDNKLEAVKGEDGFGIAMHSSPVIKILKSNIK